MDSPSPTMSSPTKALNPIPPERMNQQTVPPSPSRHSEIISPHRKSRGLSDVQSKVAFLNNLSRGNSPAPPSPTPAAPAPASSGSTAALQRAILGREEAESALLKLSGQLSETQLRERRIGEKLESLIEELQSTKERQSNERSVFEKEIRKARKEAFRAGSAVVKIQEDLKQARSEAKAFKDEVQTERDAKDQARQEAFERAYALAGLTEEVEVLKERLRTIETSNHSNTLEARARQLQKQEMGRLSLAEGDLALLMTPTPRRPKRSLEDSANSPLVYATNDSSTQCTPPKRPRLSDITPRQEDQDTTKKDLQRDMLEELQELLDDEKQRRFDAEKMIQFMQMECQFKRCSCRLSDKPETTCAHGSQLVHEESQTKTALRKNDHEIVQPNRTQHSSMRHSIQKSQPALDADILIKDEEAPDDAVLTFSPETGTFRTVPSPQRPQEQSSVPPRSSVHRVHEDESMAPSPSTRASIQRPTDLRDVPFKRLPPAHASSRLTPFTPPPPGAVSHAHHAPRLSVEQGADFELDTSGYPITQRVPLHTDESRLSNQSQTAVVPGTPVSREEALAQIRARRGRANSMKRSVSAGESLMRSAGTGAPSSSNPNRIPGVRQSSGRDENEMRSRRDLSAPVKSYHR